MFTTATSSRRDKGFTYHTERCGTVDATFRQQVRATPAAIALRTRAQSMTYVELDRASDCCAAMLRAHGGRPGCCIGLLLPRSMEAIIAMLGALKIGAGFVPFDADYPPATLAAMARDCDPTAMVVGPTSLFRSGGGLWNCPTVNLGELGNWQGASVPERTAHENPDDLAYVMYTSGSTGQPKGVMVPHRGILRLVIDADYVVLGPDEIVLQLAPLGFDACIFEIFGALLNGGTLAIESTPQPSLDDIARAITEFGVTTAWLTAGLFHLMVEQRIDALRTLRQLLAGGDVLSPTHVRRMLRAAPGCRLINGYGPTENTTFTCCHTVPADWDGTGPVPIGKPIRGTEAHILDAGLNPVATGETGELCVSGDGVALGYLRQPELTAQRFVADTLGRRFYRTGDLARQRPDGVIEFLGRIDRQVKINGKRVELEGIETALRSARFVHDAVAIADADGQRILAFVAADPEHVSEAGLADHLAARLPPWMRPFRITILEKLPLTLNGKVDREALLAQARRVGAPASAEPPRNAIERDLARIWTQVLRLPEIDRRRNFFDLGGTSLQILELHEAIRRDLGRDIPVTTLFAHSTIATLAAHLASQGSEPAPLSGVRERAARQAEALRRLNPRRAPQQGAAQ